MSAALRDAKAFDALRAFAWTLGIVMVVAAILLPFGHRFIYVAGFKSDLAGLADRIVDHQKTELVRRERFDPEAAVRIAAGDSRIEADARMLADGRMLVRVMTAADAVAARWLPAMIYERIVDPNGKATEGTWLIGG